MYELINIDANTWAYQAVMPDGDTVRFFILDGSERCLVIDSGFLDIDIRGMAEEVLRANGRDKIQLKLKKQNAQGDTKAEVLPPEKPILLANTHDDQSNCAAASQNLSKKPILLANTHDDQSNCAAASQNLSKKPILLANTHGDMDHVGGNGSFSSYYISAVDHDICGLKDRFPNTEWIPAEEGTIIDLGDRKLQYFSAPGHTKGNSVILDVTNRILFPGDIIQTGTIFMFGAHRYPSLMADSLKKIQNMKGEFDKIYACHGQPVLPPDAVDNVIAAWDKVLQGAVTPTPAIAFDNVEVHRYDCGFCRFYCDKETVLYQ